MLRCGVLLMNHQRRSWKIHSTGFSHQIYHFSNWLVGGGGGSGSSWEFLETSTLHNHTASLSAWRKEGSRYYLLSINISRRLKEREGLCHTRACTGSLSERLCLQAQIYLLASLESPQAALLDWNNNLLNPFWLWCAAGWLELRDGGGGDSSIPPCLPLICFSSSIPPSLSETEAIWHFVLAWGRQAVDLSSCLPTFLHFSQILVKLEKAVWCESTAFCIIIIIQFTTWQLTIRQSRWFDVSRQPCTFSSCTPDHSAVMIHPGIDFPFYSPATTIIFLATCELDLWYCIKEGDCFYLVQSIKKLDGRLAPHRCVMMINHHHLFLTSRIW